ncbi:hypothetical protein AMTRI_Chr10g231610 [Amborella trichopoda]|uniref:RING-type domain-containing protein n=1 Tax=Amborella trichopoda TaxID=13333 RepID=W1P7F4_AMBTC|nr:uncharacterized protein LOC18433993 [Amborella trichopoda]ERN05807.1 hypothetical protein AMTR_s00006p00258330 [Amborella trichopoda]|eukprot:XP_006844132.1 uncharacterized protein LOC18433993 [Amborella trichopoda]
MARNAEKLPFILQTLEILQPETRENVTLNLETVDREFVDSGALDPETLRCHDEARDREIDFFASTDTLEPGHEFGKGLGLEEEGEEAGEYEEPEELGRDFMDQVSLALGLLDRNVRTQERSYNLNLRSYSPSESQSRVLDGGYDSDHRSLDSGSGLDWGSDIGFGLGLDLGFGLGRTTIEEDDVDDGNVYEHDDESIPEMGLPWHEDTDFGCRYGGLSGELPLYSGSSVSNSCDTSVSGSTGARSSILSTQTLGTVRGNMNSTENTSSRNTVDDEFGFVGLDPFSDSEMCTYQSGGLSRAWDVNSSVSCSLDSDERDHDLGDFGTMGFDCSTNSTSDGDLFDAHSRFLRVGHGSDFTSDEESLIERGIDDSGDWGVESNPNHDLGDGIEENFGLPICWDCLPLDDQRDLNDDAEWEEVGDEFGEREVSSRTNSTYAGLYLEERTIDDQRSHADLEEELVPEEEPLSDEEFVPREEAVPGELVVVGQNEDDESINEDIHEIGSMVEMRNRDWAVLSIDNPIEFIVEPLSNGEIEPYESEDFVYTAAGHEILLGRWAENESFQRGSPPVSNAFVKNLASIVLTQKDADNHNTLCAVCKDDISIGERATQLPCLHHYHKGCILPWLEIRSTCPMCRYEMPTDDPEYERWRRQQVVG